MFNNAVLEEVKQMKKENEKVVIMNKKKNNPFDVTEEVKKITAESHKISDKDERIVFLKEQVKLLNERTPKWLVVYLGDGIDFYFEHDIAGNEIIKRFNLVRYPLLSEGAVYEPNRGAWRYFGKREMKSLTEKEILVMLQKWGCYKEKYISQVSRYIERMTYDRKYTKATPFEMSNPALVPFKNGTYNILTDTIEPHKAENYILTYYDYELDITGAKTPATDKFFHDFFGNSALYMKQFIGYTFYRSHAPSQEMVFLHGTGGEGKSSFITMLIENYVTSDNRTALTPQSLTSDKFAIVELLGRTLNASGDISEGFIDDTSVLKRLTGADASRGEYKGIQGFTFVSYAKHIFSMNEYFHFRDLSDGFADRLAIVPIEIGNQRLEGASFWLDHDLEAIKKESSAFVYSCIKEFMKVFDGKKAMFTQSEEMKKAKIRWLFDNDRIGQFVADSCEINVGDTRGDIASVVYTEYVAFSRQSGFTPKSATELTKWFEKKGIAKVRSRRGYDDGSSSQWRYQGVQLKTTYLIT